MLLSNEYAKMIFNYKYTIEILNSAQPKILNTRNLVFSLACDFWREQWL